MSTSILGMRWRTTPLSPRTSSMTELNIALALHCFWLKSSCICFHNMSDFNAQFFRVETLQIFEDLGITRPSCTMSNASWRTAFGVCFFLLLGWNLFILWSRFCDFILFTIVSSSKLFLQLIICSNLLWINGWIRCSFAVFRLGRHLYWRCRLGHLADDVFWSRWHTLFKFLAEYVG